MESENNQVRPVRYGCTGNYAISFIKEVINKLEGGMPLQEVLLVYNLQRSTLAVWVKRYASAQYRNNRKKPAGHLKRSAVRAITNGTMTIAEAMEACKVKRAHTIKEWLMIYQQEENSDLAALNPVVLKKPKTSETPQSNNDQIKELQQQLADAHLKIAALNTLIDVAEEQLKINIRKKPGAKQS